MKSSLVHGVVAAGLLAAVAAGARADEPMQNDILGARVNTVYGPSGLITVPDAYVNAKGRATIGTFFSKDSSVSANQGVFQNIDLGVAFLDRDGQKSKVLANAKLNLVPSNFKGFQIGVGVTDIANSIKSSTYGIVSFQTQLPSGLEGRYVGLRVHAGYGSGIYREKIIGGAELLVDNRTSLIGEWNGTKLNGAARYILAENLRAQAGVNNKEFFLGFHFGLAGR
jgi:hypothetical protein